MIGLLISLLGVLAEFLRPVFSDYSQNVFYIASILVSTGGIFFYLKNRDFLKTKINGPNPTRFMKYIPIAAVLCTIADFVLPQNFIFGMLIFLIAHILYIWAFTGLFEFTFIRRNVLILVVFFILGNIIYWGFLFKPGEFMVLVIIPYILIILIMVAMTFMHLWSDNDVIVKISLALGSTLFLISDSVLAIKRFGDYFDDSRYFVGNTYILAVFFIIHAFSLLKIVDKEKN
ncbi:MAG: lysoplasmalogenase [Candidatus Heimdallarchaeota archaeon]|nr:lysoplasmalogenase [Candidatus Heimdallarchaeota archaeon]